MAQLQEKSHENLALIALVNTTHLQYCNVDVLMPGKLCTLYTVVHVMFNCQTSIAVTTHSVWPAQPVAQFLSAVPASRKGSPSLYSTVQYMKGQFCGGCMGGPATHQKSSPKELRSYRTSTVKHTIIVVDGANHKTGLHIVCYVGKA